MQKHTDTFYSIAPHYILTPHSDKIFFPAHIRAPSKCDQQPNAFIFNVIHFQTDSLHERKGTNYDADSMRETLEGFQFTVAQIDDPTDMYIDRFKKYLKCTDFTNIPCIIIVILSHGSTNDTIYLTRGACKIDDLLNSMLDNKTLHNIPKLFFIQACKGDRKLEAEYDIEDKGPSSSSSATTEKSMLPKDVLKFYSTYEDWVCYRSENGGSIFIQTLCTHLRENGGTKDICIIVDDVLKEFDTKGENHAQMPSLVKTLAKPLILGTCIKSSA